MLGSHQHHTQLSQQITACEGCYQAIIRHRKKFGTYTGPQEPGNDDIAVEYYLHIISAWLSGQSAMPLLRE